MKILYTPQIKYNIKISGIATSDIAPEKHGFIIQKQFTESNNQDFSLRFYSILLLFIPESELDVINNLLIVIDKHNIAKIYRDFPLQLEIRAKKDIQQGSPVALDSIADIKRLKFRDVNNKITINDGDQVVYLFRKGPRLGLYFDFSRTLKVAELELDLGEYFKRLLYFETFLSIKNHNLYQEIVSAGWFPFISLIGVAYDNVVRYYKDPEKNIFALNTVLDTYDDKKIDELTEYWWRSILFYEKKSLIEAGLLAYKQKNQAGYINCIKNLNSEIEGIIRKALFQKGNNNPETKDLKKFIKQKALKNFNTYSSLGFPNEFAEYLNDVFFENFNINKGITPASRHGTAHGVATEDKFNQIKALQTILILDQIKFYLS